MGHAGPLTLALRPAHGDTEDMDKTRIVVGYDGSAHADVAVRWAAREAAQRGARLTVLTAAEVRWSDISSPAEVEKATRAWAEEVAAGGTTVARESVPGVAVDTESHLTHPVTALVAASTEAALIVVGARGHGSFTGALLGSVAFALASRAASPVVVVRARESLTVGTDHPVVVGYDGSPASERALEWAADVAAEWGAPLTVLVAWHLEAVDAWAAAYGAAALAGGGELAIDAERAAQGVARAAAESVTERHPALKVNTLVVPASPAQALIQASHSARLVVVGGRGRGRLSSVLLGSVSHAAIHGAACPVAVIRTPEPE